MLAMLALREGTFFNFKVPSFTVGENNTRLGHRPLDDPLNVDS